MFDVIVQSIQKQCRDSQKEREIISMIENNFGWTTEVRKTERIASSQLVEETLTAQKRNKHWTKIMNMVHGNNELSSKIMENWVCMPPHGYSCGYIVRSLKENRSCISRPFCSVVSFFYHPHVLFYCSLSGGKVKDKNKIFIINKLYLFKRANSTVHQPGPLEWALIKEMPIDNQLSVYSFEIRNAANNIVDYTSNISGSSTCCSFISPLL